MKKITLDNDFLRHAVDMSICEIRPLMRAYGDLSHENDYSDIKDRIIAEVIARLAADIAEQLSRAYFVDPDVDDFPEEKAIQCELDYSFDPKTLLG
jgi:hypothetical protein